MLPKIFIGSSVKGLEVAHAIQEGLTRDAHCRPWDQGVFNLSESILNNLLFILNEVDFAIFVFSPDDAIEFKTQQLLTVRDNVIFETGLFMGSIGRERVYYIKPRHTDIKLPTDLLGIITGEYDETDDNLAAAVGVFCTQVKKNINRYGYRIGKKSENHGPCVELHHVNLPVRNAEASLEFYQRILQLKEIVRMPYPFTGKWLGLPSNQQLHLIEIEKDDHVRFRKRHPTKFNPKDCHFALRVNESDWKKIIDNLEFNNIFYKKNKYPELKINQLYLLDLDDHIIEINALTPEQIQLQFK